jgi:hypothetical protein
MAWGFYLLGKKQCKHFRETTQHPSGVSHLDLPLQLWLTPPMNKPPEYISYSQYETYLSCGEKYRLSRIEQVPEQPAWYLIGGSAVHEATEAYDKALWKDQHELPF